MNMRDIAEIGLFAVLLIGAAVPLGYHLARVYDGRRTWLEFAFGRIERLLLRAAGRSAEREMGWRSYATALLVFNFSGIALLHLMQRLQAVLPYNPQNLPAVPADLAFNTAVSFVSNTNWQAYAGEAVMSPLLQMSGLAVQNFLSAATGMAVLAALARGFSRRETATIGNFWVDLVRGTLYVLLPLSILWTVLLVSQGVVQTFETKEVATLIDPVVAIDGSTRTEQAIAVGPVASQVAIKQLGTNGGGYFNANSAHPLESSSPIACFLEMLGILVIPAALTICWGKQVGDMKQGRALLCTMAVIFLPLLFLAVWAESKVPPPVLSADVAVATDEGSLGWTEGKEVRFGSAMTAVFATATTAASCGAVNGMHDSFMPIGGLVPLFLIMLGEVVFGGVGSGLYGLLIFAIVAVFVAGLMVGRTPEYMGKKIEAYEMKMATLAILLPCAGILIGTAATVTTECGRASIFNPGPHGFTEALYAFASASQNNGSAFAGFNGNTPFANFALGFAMLFGRFGVIIPVLAIAGSLASKKLVPPGPGTMPTHGPLFVTLLVGVVVIVGALTFLPALALGPIVEQLQLFPSGGPK